MGVSITIIIPAFNEGGNLAATVETVRNAVAGIVDDLEVIIVEDASTDDTMQIADRLALEDDRVRVVHNRTNMGLGYNYGKGVEIASKEYVMLIPGDNEIPGDSIRTIMAKLGESEIIIPYVVNTEVRPLFRRVLSCAFVWIINALFGLRIRYYNGTCAIRRAALQKIQMTTSGFAYMAITLVRLLKRGYSYQQVAVRLQEREKGTTKAFALRNVVQVVTGVLSLFWEVQVRNKGIVKQSSGRRSAKQKEGRG